VPTVGYQKSSLASMTNVLTDSGRTLNWNWILQALIVAKSGKMLVGIDVIQDIVGAGCVMTWQFIEVDKSSSAWLNRMCPKIQARSSRWFWVVSYSKVTNEKYAPGRMWSRGTLILALNRVADCKIIKLR
jgi:hypothetical protein